MAKVKRKVCLSCQVDKPIDAFYMSYNKVLHADGRIPYCKDCLIKMVDVDNIESVKDVLRKIDRPFLSAIWRSSSATSQKNAFGTYIKNLQMPQYRNLTWKDSGTSESVAEIQADDDVPKATTKFKVTPEIAARWGSKHSKEELMQLEIFYHAMMDANRIETPQDINYLKKLAVISLKMDKELEDGNYDQVKKLGDLFSKYMADSQFRAMDKSDATKSGGLRTFSQAYEEIEKDGFIPPWEHYRKAKGVTQDIVDKTIMYILNYTHKLNQVTQLTFPPVDTPKLEKNEADEVMQDGT